MKRFLSLLATGALALGLSASASAQNRGIGAGALVLDDGTNSNPLHLITIETPQPFPVNAEYQAWQLAGFPDLTWTAPVPPVTGAQSGFIYNGPTSGSIVPDIAYWVPPNKVGFNNSGGYAGAWDYATAAQLNLASESGLNNNQIPEWSTGGGDFVGSSLYDNGATVSTTENFSASGGTITFGGIGGLGVVHSSAGGVLSSSLIVNADITNGTIQNVKLANSTIAIGSTAGTLLVTGSPISLGGTAGNVDLNLANANTWTATQTLPATAGQGNALITSVNAGNTAIDVGSGGTGRTTFTDHGVILGNTAAGLDVTAVGATNTVLHGNTGADPTFSAIVVGDITPGGNNTFLNTSNTGVVGWNALNIGTSLTGNGSSGGTALAINLANANTWTATQTLPATAGQGNALVASVNAGSTAIDVGSGGTGETTLAQHGVVIGNGTTGVNVTAVGATGTVLHGNTGADPTYSAIGVGDITPGGNNTFLNTSNTGVVGWNALNVGASLTGNGSSGGTALAINLANANTWTATQTLPTTAGQGNALVASVNAGSTAIDVGSGGTGETTLAQHGVVIGNGTTGVSVTAVGATGTVLHGNTGADPTYSAIGVGDITPGGNNTFLNTSNTGVVGWNALNVGASLTGNGSSGGTALAINLANANTWTATQTLPTTAGQGNALVASVNAGNTAIDVGSGGTGETTLAQHGVVIGNAAGGVNVTAVGATGTVLHGNTGADPTYSAIGVGDITPGGNNTFLNTSNTGVVGWNALNVGTSLTGNGSSGGTALAINLANANTWTATQTLPTTAGQGNALVTSVNAGNTAIDVGSGGTGQTTLTQHGVVIGNGTTGVSVTAVGATGTVLHGNTGADPTYSQIAVGTDIAHGAANTFLTTAANGTTVAFTGLSIGAGLTGNGIGTALDANIQHDGSLSGTGGTASNLVLNVANANTWAATQTLPATTAQGNALVTSVNAGNTAIDVGSGGTGRTTFTAHGVILGNAAAGLDVTAVGATGTVLHGNTGADPTYSAIGVGDITPGGNNTFLNTSNTGVVGWNALNVGTSLTGNGSSGGTALAINLANANTWTATQTLPTTAGQGNALVTSVNAGNTAIDVGSGGTGQTTLTQHGVVIGNAAGGVNVTAVGATGTVLHGNTGADPTYSAIGVGDITPGGNNTFLNTSNTGVVGWNALNVGASLTGNGSSGGTALAINLANANTWTATQTLPTTAGQGNALVTSVNAGNTAIDVGSGGTGQTTLTQHGVVIGNAAGGVNVTAVGATGTVLHGNTGADPTYSQIAVGTDIAHGAANTFLTTAANGTTVAFTGLSIGAGLTGNGIGTALDANIQHDGSLSGTGGTASNLVLNVANANTWTATQTLPTTAGQGNALVASVNAGSTAIDVGSGGTGETTLTQHGVVIGNAAGGVNVTAVGATNTVLLGNTGADPSFGTVPNAALTNDFIDFTSSAGTLLSPSGDVALGGTANYDLNLANANMWTAQQQFTDATANAASARFFNTFVNAAAGDAIAATIASTGAGAGTNTGLVITVQNSTGANQGIAFAVSGGSGTHTDIVGTSYNWFVGSNGNISSPNGGNVNLGTDAATAGTVTLHSSATGAAFSGTLRLLPTAGLFTTANRAYNFQDASGTVAFLTDITNDINTAINGSSPNIPVFTGLHTIGNSLLSDNSSNLSYDGNFTVSTAGAVSGVTTLSASSTVTLTGLSSAAPANGFLALNGSNQVVISNASIISGSGTGGTIPIWTGVGASSTLGNSDLTDNGTTLSYSGTNINSSGNIQTGGTTRIDDLGNFFGDGANLSNLDASSITSGFVPLANGGTAVDNTSITNNYVFAGPSSGGAGDAGFRALVDADLPSDLGGEYIQNQSASAQASSSFWISGNGTIGGTLYATDIEDAVGLTVNTSAVGSTSLGNATGGTSITGTNWNVNDVAGGTADFLGNVTIGEAADGTAPILSVTPSASGDYADGIAINPTTGGTNFNNLLFFRNSANNTQYTWFVGRLGSGTATPNYFEIGVQGLSGMVGTVEDDAAMSINPSTGNINFGGNVAVGGLTTAGIVTNDVNGNLGTTAQVQLANGGTAVDNTNIGQNLVFAGPAGSAGDASFRALVDADLPSDLGTEYIQNTNSQQASSNFNISGNGTIGGTLNTNTIQSSAGLDVNTTPSTSTTTIGNSTGQTFVQGPLNANVVQSSAGLDVNTTPSTSTTTIGNSTGQTFVQGPLNANVVQSSAGLDVNTTPSTSTTTIGNSTGQTFVQGPLNANVVQSSAGLDVNTTPSTSTTTIGNSTGQTFVQGPLNANVVQSSAGLDVNTTPSTSTTTIGNSTGGTTVQGPLTASGTVTLSGISPGAPTGGFLALNGTTVVTSNANVITGTGTEYYVPVWNNAGGTTLGSSEIYDNGTTVSINTGAAGAEQLEIGPQTGNYHSPLKVGSSTGAGATFINYADPGMSANARYDAGQWLYDATGTATNVDLNAGQFVVSTAPSGTGGSHLVFTPTLTVDVSGNLTAAGNGSFVGLTSSGNTTLGTGSNTVNTFGSGGGGSSSNTFGNTSNNNQFGNQAASNNFGNTATSNNQFGNNTPSNEFGDAVNATSTYANDFGSATGTSTGTVTNTIGVAVSGSTVNTTIGGGAGTSSVAIQSGTTWGISGGGGVQFHFYQYTGGGVYAANANDYYIDVTSGTGVAAPSGVAAGQKLVITNATGTAFTSGGGNDFIIPPNTTWNLIFDGTNWQLMN